MGMTCELRQVSAEYAQRLLHNPDEIMQYFENVDEGELPEEAQGEDLDLDKAWHAIHYLLTGTAEHGEAPWGYLLLGGEQVGNEEDHDIGYGPARILLTAQVTAFYGAVATLSPTEISARFKPVEMEKLDIYPAVWNRRDEQLEEWLQENVTDLLAFLQRASNKEQAVIIAIA